MGNNDGRQVTHSLSDKTHAPALALPRVGRVDLLGKHQIKTGG